MGEDQARYFWAKTRGNFNPWSVTSGGLAKCFDPKEQTFRRTVSAHCGSKLGGRGVGCLKPVLVLPILSLHSWV